jgi:hypothetical protein
MGGITLRSGHIVVRGYGEAETVWPGSADELSRYFFHALEIDPEFTLGDLFALLDRAGIEFLEVVLGEHIVPLLEEARVPPLAHDDLRIEYLTVTNVHSDDCLYRELSGWGPWDEPYDGAWAKDPDYPRRGSINVSMTPVNQLLQVPLRYDPELIFWRAPGVEAYRTRIDITFLDFIKAIFYDLTFYGPPAERDAMRDELQRRVEEIDRGEVELIPGEEVFRELRERLGDGEEP